MRTKVAAVTYFEPRDWVIGVSAVLVAMRIGAAIRNSLSGVLYVLKDIAEDEGDLTKRLEAHAQDEAKTVESTKEHAAHPFLTCRLR